MRMFALLLLAACKADPDALDSDPGDTDVAVDTDVGDTDPTDTDCELLLWWPDGDGDGFGGASAAPVDACDAPAGHTSDSTDCDDGDGAVNPDAVEVCNGRDDDCDPAGEGRLATFYADDGAVEDLSAALLAGSWTAPATRVLDAPGVLHLCGKFTASLRLRADVDVVGHGAAELSGGGASATVVIRAPIAASVSDVVLSDGVGVGIVLGELTAGGGLECASAAALRLSRVTIERNAAEVGAGIYAAGGCALTIEESAITGNDAGYYGGGLALIGATATIVDSTVEGGTAGYGGGIALVDGAAVLTRTLVSGNDADQGGGALIEGGDLRCEADPSDVAGFTANTAREGGAAYLDEGALTSAGCDWGVGASDNAPPDVHGEATRYGDDQTFVCDSSGCAP